MHKEVSLKDSNIYKCHEATGNIPLKTKFALCFAAVTQLSRSQTGVTNMLHLLLGILFISLQCQLRGRPHKQIYRETQSTNQTGQTLYFWIKDDY